MLHSSSSSSPPSEADLFLQDDLEFRTVTTLLSLLSSREKVQLGNFQVSSKYRPYLKLLTGFSSLLIRHHEVIAVLPKRSANGTELFMSVQEGNSEAIPTDHYSSNSSPSSPSSSPSRPSSSGSAPFLDYYVTCNPRQGDSFDTTVAFYSSPELVLGPDIVAFILQNWNLSFDIHIKAIETLLNICLANISSAPSTAPSIAWSNLTTYSFLQSVEKTHKRFHKSTFIKNLNLVKPLSLKPPPNFLGLTRTDDTMIKTILREDSRAADIHSSLFSFVKSPRPRELERRLPDDPALLLVQFHDFFAWFLGAISSELSMLAALRKRSNRPEQLPSQEIFRARRKISALRYFTWGSDFFFDYVRSVLASDLTVPDTSELEQGGSNTEEGLDEGPDIATEFETEDGPEEKSEVPSSLTHRALSDLRLITSNFQHIDLLKSGNYSFRGHEIRFRILKYPRADRNHLKPWRDVIADLFDQTTAEQVIEALSYKATVDKRFNVFLPNGPLLRFNGQAHCEAVLGCLHVLANCNSDTSWTGIPSDVLRTLKSCYNLIAPSKRCCPICAATIDLLGSQSETRLHALSKHNIISACAFPPGIPRGVRVALLRRYKKELTLRLVAFCDEVRQKSWSSGQSETVSLDENEQDAEHHMENEAAQMVVEELEGLSFDEKKVKWDTILDEETDQACLCWSMMQENVRLGLAPPPGVGGGEGENIS